MQPAAVTAMMRNVWRVPDRTAMPMHGNLKEETVA